MTREEAEKLFEKKYEEAIKHEHIENKAAWALYQAWQEADKYLTNNQAIDRLEKAREFLHEYYGSKYYDTTIDMAIKALSEEEKTAKWIAYPSFINYEVKVSCSHCTHIQDKPTNYCSSCGAKMESEDEE